ncbi:MULTISPECIES: 16S rRNA (guanine(527)-N(7))-methyltransferase RsmG [Sporomusa]|uniref:Ribosomal RNA small subunit methyltransferase G n=1 Tax=Sporomusa sphaeroides DSM 2875 TaxID=1337886 RepID=A0ABM9W2S8_9FIRM|nr:16S rRNA (guanine(527)-N(7))-methyltransferase RsmG [Sporomusa sphaeroides]MCM0759398.1 16S rRNA (guanine(527)-N(7))-methyltransferase RsmG [Sporomusa sphaeroides DSM 2875]OLS56485.1 ribosomal RNA small subunit methyltransferase G [Sporomusa sphaeroides DSM 2875]CVK18580.1 Ribosomal RNA small subunit methyltransferase G [Sporomusa sphaeroides DSM 2875]HML35553.1 16S rRNA (guanine(527)-N(7))-methyltransferase RsmG [Sporomusa sphaeroides]
MGSFQELVANAAAEYGLQLTNGQIAAMDTYYRLLLEWNEKMNLTAITEPHEVAVKHMIDSLSCYREEIFTAAARIVDVGTGAGFPGIPLKIFQPELELILMDSLNKRLNFLREVAGNLGLQGVAFVHARAEEAGKNKQHRESYDIAVSRAVARLNVLCELCLPMVKVGGWFIALKGAQYEDEVHEAAKALTILGGKVADIRPVSLPGLADKRAVIYIKKVAATPPSYPRKAGTPEKKPL